MKEVKRFAYFIFFIIPSVFIMSAAGNDPLEGTSNTAVTQLEVDRVLADLENAHRVLSSGRGRNLTQEEKDKSTRANEDLMKAVQEIRAIGDLATDRIVMQIRQVPEQSEYRNHLVGVLREMKGPQAVQAPKQFFIEVSNTANSDASFYWITGLDIDEELLPKVLARVRYPSLFNAALTALDADPSSNFSKEKVQAIAQSMQAVVGVPHVEWGYRSLEGSGIGSLADTLYRNRVLTLVKMKGVDESIRSEVSLQPEGIVRDLLKISLGFRGDMQSGREPMKAFLMNSEYRTLPNNRLSCVEAFNKFGDKTDLPFLQEITTSDPYCVEEYAYYQKCEKWHDEYINRTELQIKNESTSFAPLQTVDEKQTPTKVTYPIREAAKKAIEAIEARAAQKGK